jgi:hypothetical protein
MNKNISRLLHCVSLFDGCRIRKLIGVVIITTGFVRIFGTDPVLSSRSAAMIAIYGVLQVVIGLALLLTNHEYRTSSTGRIIAAMAFSLLIVLIVQFWPYPTGFAYIIFSYSLLMEIITLQPCTCALLESSNRNDK